FLIYYQHGLIVWIPFIDIAIGCLMGISSSFGTLMNAKLGSLPYNVKLKFGSYEHICSLFKKVGTLIVYMNPLKNGQYAYFEFRFQFFHHNKSFCSISAKTIVFTYNQEINGSVILRNKGL